MQAPHGCEPAYGPSKDVPACPSAAAAVLYAAVLSLLFDAGLLDQANTEVMIGSEFPHDDSAAQFLGDLMRVKKCMEQGKTLAMLHTSDGLYAALYDLFNQHYTSFGSQLYARLAFGNSYTLCSLSPTFRVVVVAEQRVALEQMAAPLLNRFEKQELTRGCLVRSLPPGASDDLAGVGKVPRAVAGDRWSRAIARLSCFARKFAAGNVGAFASAAIVHADADTIFALFIASTPATPVTPATPATPATPVTPVTPGTTISGTTISGTTTASTTTSTQIKKMLIFVVQPGSFFCAQRWRGWPDWFLPLTPGMPWPKSLALTQGVCI